MGPFTDIDILADFGLDLTAPTPAPRRAASSLPTSRKTTNTPDLRPAVIFCPDSLTVKEVEVDVANPQSNGMWFPTSRGTFVMYRFLGASHIMEKLLALVNQVECIRTEAIHAENRLVAQMFHLAAESRPDLVDSSTAPVAVTRDMFEEGI